MAGGASRTARLQYLSNLKPGGRQPRNRRDVGDPLLLAPQKKRTSNLLWVLVFQLLTLAKTEATVDEIGKTIFPRRPSTTCKQLPRQPAEASGAATPGFFPLRTLCAVMRPTLI